MSNRRYNQFYSSPHNYPVQLDCNFTVNATNASGVTSLLGQGIANVFMHTSTTPTAGSPNPAAGYIYVLLQDNYKSLYSAQAAITSPNSGSAINIDASDAALTIGQVYVITSLGTSTAADWVAVGVPIGTSAAVGVSFVAIATGAGTGTGAVQIPKATGSGINHIELVGSSKLQLSNSRGQVMGSTSGSYLIFQCLAATNSSTTTLHVAAPADGTVISLELLLSNSRIGDQGQ